MKQFLFVFLSLFCLPVFASAEEITSFTSDIYLNADGTFRVEEGIVYDFGEAQRHGIFRYLPKEHPQADPSFLKDQYIDIELLEVLIDGFAVPYDISNTNDQKEIKIGDPNSTISGEHTYTITYKASGGYSYFDDNTAELFWNATGNQWQVPIQKVEVRLSAPSGFFSDMHACYVGADLSKTPCEDTAIEGAIIKFSQTELLPGEGLTVAVEINASMVDVVIKERFKLAFVLGLIGPVTLIVIAFLIYKYRTKYKTGNTIIAQYEPYENFKPMYAGMLLDGRLDPRDITAGIIYLAQQGYIKIVKTDKKVLFVIDVDDYVITLLQPVANVADNFSRDILTMFFSGASNVGDSVSLSDLKEDRSKQTSNLILLQSLKSDLKRDMKENGFYQVLNLHKGGIKPKSLLGKVGLLAFGFTVYVFFNIMLEKYDLFLPILFVTIALVVFFTLAVYERRTRKGYEALDHLKGFKLFLSVTDGERFKFHNAPEKSPEQFMKYLPYAIAFGVEKQWAKVFENVTLPDPEWYDGGNVHAFSAVNLTSSLGAFSGSFVASSVSGSGSRSSSSFGGSGGGGFSGGGGGGGGGGSW